MTGHRRASACGHVEGRLPTRRHCASGQYDVDATIQVPFSHELPRHQVAASASDGCGELRVAMLKMRCIVGPAFVAATVTGSAGASAHAQVDLPIQVACIELQAVGRSSHVAVASVAAAGIVIVRGTLVAALAIESLATPPGRLRALSTTCVASHRASSVVRVV